MKLFRVFLALLLLPTLGAPALLSQAQKVQVSAPQLSDDDGLRSDPALNAVFNAATDTFGQLYGQEFSLVSAAAPGSAKLPRISTLAAPNADWPVISIKLELGEVENQKVLYYHVKDLTPKILANAMYYLCRLSLSPPPTDEKLAPQLIDVMDTTQLAPLDVQSYNKLSVATATKNNGNLVVGLGDIIAELDTKGRLISHYGKELLRQGNYLFAYSLSVSPSGTILGSGPSSSSAWQFTPTGTTRVVNLPAGTMLQTYILADGSLLVKDYSSANGMRIEGRKRTEMRLAQNPNNPYMLVAPGPDSTIFGFEQSSGELRAYDRNGTLLDQTLPLLPSETVAQIRQFCLYPDGSVLFAGNEYLGRFDRLGRPIWQVRGKSQPMISDQMLVNSLSFDPLSASIYLTRSGKPMIIRLFDRAWAKEYKIDGSPLQALAKATARLDKDPEDWDALQDKVKIYQANGAIELANAELLRLVNLDASDQATNQALAAIKLKRFLEAAELSKPLVLSTMRTVGPESARVDYMNVLKLYEQVLAIDRGNKQASNSRNELINAMKQAEQSPADFKLPELQIAEARLDNLFPALAATYRSNPVGKIRLKNEGTTAASKLRVSVFIPRLMDYPSDMPVQSGLGGGKEIEIPLTIQLNQETLKVEEDLPIQAQIHVSWEEEGKTLSLDKSVNCTLYRRTALTWDQSGKLAAFITPNEENVAAFALRSLDQAPGLSPNEAALAGFSPKIWRAAVIANALGSYGIAYLEDPQSPISRSLGKTETIDTVRFPRTTLFFKSGDCDDTSALLGSLFEAAGLQTAIMTTPGHVFIAFDTGEPAENAWVFGQPNSGSYLLKNKTVWLPVETTLLKQGFYQAWQGAAKLVSQHLGSAELEMLPVHEQWNQFPPIPLPISPYQLVLPSILSQKNLLALDGKLLLDKLFEKSLSQLQTQIPAAGKQRLAILNRSGILQARFGMSDAAIQTFMQALREDKQHLSAYLNLGSLYLQNGKFSDSVGILLQAKGIRPDSGAVHLLLAQAYNSLGDTIKTQEAFLALSTYAPELAAQNAWLGKGNPSGQAGGASLAGGGSAERAASGERKLSPVWSSGE